MNAKNSFITKQSQQKGQSLFEFIFFLPFLIGLIFFFHTIINSLNASINQQKIVRGYFYKFIRNNSYILSSNDLTEYLFKANFRHVGFFAIGWQERSTGPGSAQEPISACFKLNAIGFKSKLSSIPCENKITNFQGPFIKIFTVYGLCTSPFHKKEGIGIQEQYLYRSNASCSLKK